MTWPCKPRIGRRQPRLYAQVLYTLIRAAPRNNACREREREPLCAAVCTRRANTVGVNPHWGRLARCQRAWADRLTSWQRAGPRPPDTSLSVGPPVSRNSLSLSLPSILFGVTLLPWSFTGCSGSFRWRKLGEGGEETERDGGVTVTAWKNNIMARDWIIFM